MKISVILISLLAMIFASCTSAPSKLPQRYISQDRKTAITFVNNGNVVVTVLYGVTPIDYPVGEWVNHDTTLEVRWWGETLIFRAKRNKNTVALEAVNAALCPQIMATWHLSTQYEAEEVKTEK